MGIVTLLRFAFLLALIGLFALDGCAVGRDRDASTADGRHDSADFDSGFPPFDDGIPSTDSGTNQTDTPSSSGYHVLSGDTESFAVIDGTADGGSFEMTCASNSVAVGILGRSGDWNDRIALICAPVNRDATLGSAMILPARGGIGGTDYMDMCGPREVVVRISGRYGLFLDSIAITCAVLDAWIAGTAMPTTHAPHGGDGGGTAYDDTCIAGYVIHDLQGITGLYVNAVWPECVHVTD
jgi:hypothetical protein